MSLQDSRLLDRHLRHTSLTGARTGWGARSPSIPAARAGRHHPAEKNAATGRSARRGFAGDRENGDFGPIQAILAQHTVALKCAKSLELSQNGFLRGNHRLNPALRRCLALDLEVSREDGSPGFVGGVASVLRSSQGRATTTQPPKEAGPTQTAHRRRARLRSTLQDRRRARRPGRGHYARIGAGPEPLSPNPPKEGV